MQQQIRPRMDQQHQQQQPQQHQQQQHQQQQHQQQQHAYQLPAQPQPQAHHHHQQQHHHARQTGQFQPSSQMIQTPAQGRAPTDRMLREPMESPSGPYSSAEVMQHTATSSPTEPHTSDPMHLSETQGGDNSPDGRKGYGKRELSTSKRAAQNRAAQRAFRQRKEGYIKKLEEQVREYGVLSENYKAIQQENYQLRDYIISLQSKLLEAQGEVPAPPGGLDGLQPGSKQGLGPQQQAQQQPPAVGPPSQVPGTATLPRLSELGAVQQTQQPPHPIQPQQTYDTKMTSAQAALQGPSILHSPTGSR